MAESSWRSGDALRESERFLATLLSNLPGWVYRCRNDPDWTLEYLSPGIEAVTGYPPAAFMPDGNVVYADLIHPEDRHLVWEGVQRALSQGVPFQVSYRIRCSQGVEKWVWEQGRAITEPTPAGDMLLEGFITEITPAKRAEHDARRSNEKQRMLLRELDHRVRNNLASLVALIDISSRNANSVQELADSMRQRVQAMSTAHGLLSQSHHGPLDLRTLIEALVPDELEESFQLDGPEVSVSPRQSTALGMILQELITNALKHGSLRSASGRVAVSWRVIAGSPDDPNASAMSLELRWQEHGGEPVKPPSKERVGTTLINGLIRAELRGTVEMTYPESGASHRLLLRLDLDN